MMDALTRNHGAVRALSGAAPTVLVAQVSSDWNWSKTARPFAELVGRLAPERGEGGERLVHAVRGLIENAVRHSAGGGVRLSLCVDALTGDFRVQTENQAGQRDWLRLRDRLALLSARGAEGAYRELLADTAEEGHDVGLGLARLADEAHVRLAARAHEGQVHVVAASRAPSFLPPAAIQGTSVEDVALYVSHEGEGALPRESWDGYARALADSLLSGAARGASATDQIETSGAGRASRATGRWPRVVV